jgi:hypothetical protein
VPDTKPATASAMIFFYTKNCRFPRKIEIEEFFSLIFLREKNFFQRKQEGVDKPQNGVIYSLFLPVIPACAEERRGWKRHSAAFLSSTVRPSDEARQFRRLDEPRLSVDRRSIPACALILIAGSAIPRIYEGRLLWFPC